MRTTTKTMLLSVAALAFHGAWADEAKPAQADAQAKRANFVACPMVRNTYVPCWVAEHEGEMYYPGDGYPDPPHHRTPGPSNSEREERRRPAAEEISTQPRRFDVPFAFDVGTHLYSRDSQIVGAAARYAAASKATHVEVIGYRGGALLSSGERFMEREEIAAQRADMVKKMLIHAGVPERNLHVRTMTADAPDGIDDFELRRATIVVGKVDR